MGSLAVNLISKKIGGREHLANRQCRSLHIRQELIFRKILKTYMFSNLKNDRSTQSVK